MKLSVFVLLFLLSFALALAQGSVAPQGTPPAATAEAATQATPSGIVKDVYQFSLMIGGLLAFGAIVFGAIKYTLAAGNPSGQHEGKEWITQALLGLLLLVGATLVLNTINPKLALLELPELVRLAYKPPATGQICAPPKRNVLNKDGVLVCTDVPVMTGCNLIPSPGKSNGCPAATPRCVIDNPDPTNIKFKGKATCVK